MRNLLALLLVMCAIVLLYLHLPAAWAEYALRDRIDPLTLADMHGSTWNGEARRSWMGETATGWLRWQAESMTALRGTLRAQLHFTLPRDQTIDAHVSWTANRLQVDALHAELLGSALQRFFQTIDLQPIGQLRVDVGHALLNRGVPVALRGQATWRQATLLGPRLPIFLGDLRADFHAASPGLGWYPSRSRRTGACDRHPAHGPGGLSYRHGNLAPRPTTRSQPVEIRRAACQRFASRIAARCVVVEKGSRYQAG